MFKRYTSPTKIVAFGKKIESKYDNGKKYFFLSSGRKMGKNVPEIRKPRCLDYWILYNKDDMKYTTTNITLYKLKFIISLSF